MAYRDFTLEDLKRKFGIRNKVAPLFDGISINQVSVSDWLNKSLSIGQKLRLRTEKAKSEAIVMPILLELKDKNDDFLMIHSGNTLKVDKERGLNGECDFILSANPTSYIIDTPIISVVEAKNDDLAMGVGQCAAQMYASKIRNEEEGEPLEIIFGCVTNGRDWQFMKLENKQLLIDEKVYFIENLETILGIFQHIIDYYKSILESVAA